MRARSGPEIAAAREGAAGAQPEPKEAEEAAVARPHLTARSSSAR